MDRSAPAAPSGVMNVQRILTALGDFSVLYEEDESGGNRIR